MPKASFGCSLVLALAAEVAAHICIIEPPQRGNLSVTTPGDPSCYRRTNYCGGIPAPRVPTTTLVAGSKSVIKFQQNLNHWYSPNPGYFDVSLAYTLDPTEADFHPLYFQSDFAGMEMVQSTTFNVALEIPDRTCVHCILRARYVSHNPMEIDPKDNTASIFYNCADIAIVPKASGMQEAVPATPILGARPAEEHAIGSSSMKGRRFESRILSPPDQNASCATPKQWRASFLESNAWGWVEHTIWWDATRNLSRWDKNGTIDASGDSHISLINNYTAPIEYVNFVAPSQTCHIYGNDQMYPWAYGAVTGMQHRGRTATGGVDFWRGTGYHPNQCADDHGAHTPTMAAPRARVLAQAPPACLSS